MSNSPGHWGSALPVRSKNLIMETSMSNLPGHWGSARPVRSKSLIMETSQEIVESSRPNEDAIEQFFDLEAASLPQTDQDYSSSEAIPGFEPIGGHKVDQHVASLNEALQHENGTGGNGPWVHPWSENSWMGTVRATLPDQRIGTPRVAQPVAKVDLQ
ncbi:Uu.00g020830.m01.CDS01 [Anthostomella pinea]|uniref:Uu.00g020830.m01.CDS01 n=1 Tax=Anthostomella pinea TaxID=933095 RepID=A0AAI8W069_9PEZI|nr:Uu.00g020830.m01.CDS01 [Anthostomella pinea]